MLQIFLTILVSTSLITGNLQSAFLGQFQEVAHIVEEILSHEDSHHHHDGIVHSHKSSASIRVDTFGNIYASHDHSDQETHHHEHEGDRHEHQIMVGVQTVVALQPNTFELSFPHSPSSSNSSVYTSLEVSPPYQSQLLRPPIA